MTANPGAGIVGGPHVAGADVQRELVRRHMQSGNPHMSLVRDGADAPLRPYRERDLVQLAAAECEELELEHDGIIGKEKQ